jgi:glycosyltransferase involved in cell wall biosynthesis
MIRIIYDYQVFSWQKFGGISRYICEVAAHLHDKKSVHDLNVQILAPMYVNQYIKELPSQMVTGVSVPKVKRTGTIINLMNQILTRLYLESNPPNILHRTFYKKKIWKTKPKRTKAVLTVYDMIDEKFSPESSFCQVKREAIESADHIISISQNTRKDLLELMDIDPEKVSVVYLGHSLLSKASKSDQLSVQVDEPRPYILYVGERSGYKNFVSLLRAYSSSKRLLEDFNLVCFGGGDFSQSELDIISSLAIPNENVRYVSGSDEKLIAYYREANVFTYPSLYEGFGIPPLEAMSLGCPVVCGNVSSLPEVVGDAAELCDPSRPESIAFSLEKVLFSDEYSKLLRQQGLAQSQQFSWEKCAEETFKVYQSIANS